MDIDEEHSRGFYIKEQNLKLVPVTYWQSPTNPDIYSVIAREVDYKKGINMGDLRTGIVRRVPYQDEYGSHINLELLLPFSKSLLYAWFNDDGSIKLAYTIDRVLEHKQISLNENGTIKEADYAFLSSIEEKVNSIPIRVRTKS